MWSGTPNINMSSDVDIRGGATHIMCLGVNTGVGTSHMKIFSDVHTMVGTPHMMMSYDVHTRTGTHCMEMSLDIQTRVGTPPMKMCSDVDYRVGTLHIHFGFQLARWSNKVAYEMRFFTMVVKNYK